jgi:uncharacterized protein
MAVFFLDTSAIVKRYVAEVGSGWVMALCDPRAGHTILISQATQAEAAAALCRKAFYGAISAVDRDRTIAIFRRDVRRTYRLERVTNAICVRAGDLCRSHNLRAYDAVQLACALTAREKFATIGLPAPVFVTADTELLGFATAEGLGVDDPNSHP